MEQTRNKIAGENLQWARQALGYSTGELAKKWKEYNKSNHLKDNHGLPVNRRTITRWEENGVPLRCARKNGFIPLPHIANFFSVQPELFTEKSYENEVQNKIIEAYSAKKERLREIVKGKATYVSPYKLEEEFERFKGCYEAFFHFTAFNEDEELKSWIYKPIIEIHEIKQETNCIKARLYGHRIKPYMEGIFIPKTNKLFFIFQTPDDTPDDKDGLVFIIARREPIDKIQGLILAEPTPREGAMKSGVLPVAARILLKKINEENYQTSCTLTGHECELQAADVDREILDCIENHIRCDVLKAFEVK